MRSRDEATALNGKPPPMPLPMVMISGLRPNWSEAHIVPVRPKPVRISSTIRRAPHSSAMSRTAWMKSSGGTTLPAVPCIGSTNDRRDLGLGIILDHVTQMLGAGKSAGRIFELPRAAVAIGVRRKVHARRERTLMIAVAAAEKADDARGLAVVAAPEADKFEFLGDRLGEPEGGLDRLGAAREELDMGHALPAAVELTRLRKRARVSVAKLPKVTRSSCSLRRLT